jgi:hypothetical protein
MKTRLVHATRRKAEQRQTHLALTDLSCKLTGSYDTSTSNFGQQRVQGQVAPAGVPLVVSPAGAAGLRRITLYQLSRLWANALAV